MTDDLQAYLIEFEAGLVHAAHEAEEGALVGDVFAEAFLKLLEELEELDNAFPCSYRKRGMQVDGYAFMEDGAHLELVVAEYLGAQAVETLPAAKVQAAVKRARGFFLAAREGLHSELEPSTAAHDLAEQIHKGRADIETVRITLVTDGVVRAARIEPDEADGVRIEAQVWDLERLHRSQTSGQSREKIVVDLAEYGGPIEILSDEEKGEYTTMLAVMPGQTLADLYEIHGSRLLERNVRSFLERKGPANKGMRKTILEEPEKFLIYNNGLTATAETVETQEDGERTFLTKIHDFQIVNGGQTTASLYHTQHKEKADLARVRVQLKLTVVHDAKNIEETVARISEFSNTQNRITLSDLSSNHAFHRALQELSRTIWAPDPQGGKALTHWYYERARGQYNDDLFRAGGGTRWKALNPRAQKFDKTDLAKVENAWAQHPWVVARGGQRSFHTFMEGVKAQPEFVPDDRYFHAIVARLILFKAADGAARRAGAGSYKAHIVAYTISLLSHLSGQRIDLEAIWAAQRVSERLQDELDSLADEVLKRILASAGQRNVTEWTKKTDCWQDLLRAKLALSPAFQKQLVNVAEKAMTPRPRERDLAADEQAKVQKATQFGPAAWKELAAWGKETGALTPKQRQITYKIGSYIEKGWEVSAAMAHSGLAAMDEARRRGFEPKVVAQ